MPQEELFKMIVNQRLQLRKGPFFESKEALQDEITRLGDGSDQGFLFELTKLQGRLVAEEKKYNEMTKEEKNDYISNSLSYNIAKKALSELEENQKKLFIETFYEKLVLLSTMPGQSDILSLMDLEQVDEAIYKKIFVSLIEETYKAIEVQANDDYMLLRPVALQVPLTGDSLLIETQKLISEGIKLNDTNQSLIKHLVLLAQKKIERIFSERYFDLINLINTGVVDSEKRLRTTRDDPLALAMSQAILASIEFTPGEESTKTNKLIDVKNKYCKKPDLESLMSFLTAASAPRKSWIGKKEFAETKSVETFFEKLPKDKHGLIKGKVCNELHVLHAMNKTISALKNKPFSGSKLKKLRDAREAYIRGDCERADSLKKFLVAAGERRFRGEYADTNSINVFYQSIPKDIRSDILKVVDNNVVDNKESVKVNLDEFAAFKDKLRKFKTTLPETSPSQKDDSRANTLK